MTVASLFLYYLLEHVSSWNAAFYIQGGCSALGLVLAVISPMNVKWVISENQKKI